MAGHGVRREQDDPRSAAGRRARSPGWAWLLLAAGLAGLLSWAAPSPAQRDGVALVLELRGAIGPAGADYVGRGLREAASRGARVAVLEIDTPGGLDTSMREIVQAILASPVPVVVYVVPEGARAASAGTYILYAAHVAAMAPATTLGAATPVAIGLPGQGGRPGESERPEKSEKPAADAMTAKQVNDAAAFIRGLAQLHGRNAQWAERAVREAVSLTSGEALKEGVVDLVAHDLAALLAGIDGRVVRTEAGELRLETRGLAIERLPPDWRHRLLSVIAHPGVALVLMMLGFYGLVLEFSSPGFGVAGITGAICLLLGLFALQMLPVNYVGLALILLGMALLAAELFAPGFGVLGAGGLVALVAGGILLFDRDLPGFAVSVALVVGLSAGAAAVVLFGGSLAMRARARPVVSGLQAMVGAHGTVAEVEAGEGWAIVEGERWRIADPAGLQPGQRVRVTAVSGLVVQVRPDEESEAKEKPR